VHVDAVDMPTHVVVLAECLAADGADGVADLVVYAANVAFEVALALEGAVAGLAGEGRGGQMG